MDRHISQIIGMIKEDMNAHAHESMNLPTPSAEKYCEIVGAYRGMQHCLNIIDKVLRADEETERKADAEAKAKT